MRMFPLMPKLYFTNLAAHCCDSAIHNQYEVIAAFGSYKRPTVGSQEDNGGFNATLSLINMIKNKAYNPRGPPHSKFVLQCLAPHRYDFFGILTGEIKISEDGNR